MTPSLSERYYLLWAQWITAAALQVPRSDTERTCRQEAARHLRMARARDREEVGT